MNPALIRPQARSRGSGPAFGWLLAAAACGALALVVSDPVAAAFLPGVALIAFGVAGLRTMARRSVSLRALTAIRDGDDPRGRFDDAMVGRVEELERFGLVRVSDRQFVITRAGRRALAAVRLLR